MDATPQSPEATSPLPGGSGRFQTLVVGVGRSGLGLHLPVLARIRADGAHADLFADRPPVAFDLVSPEYDPPGTAVAASLAQATEMADPRQTVVHVCTPPAARVGVVEQLARLGYRRLVLEKPLALDERELWTITRLQHDWQLRLAVVAPWLASALTHRLEQIRGEGRLGRLRSILVVQRKPRFTRSLAGPRHPTAFDVEVPHAVGVALRLAGAGRVRQAGCTDMHVDGAVVPRMGRAWLHVEHADGIRTDVRSDFTSPVRERRIMLEFEHGRLVGHYPCSEDDHTAQLQITTDGETVRSILHDDALSAFMLRTYRRFAACSDQVDEHLRLQRDVVRLLSQAKGLSAISRGSGAPTRADRTS